MFCKYCGVKVPDDTAYCPDCGGYIRRPAASPSATEQAAPAAVPGAVTPAAADWKRYAKWAIPVLALVLAVILIVALCAGGRCDYGGCDSKTVSGSDYCYSHKCTWPDCHDGQFSYSSYCYSHYLLYDDEATTYTQPVYDWELTISDVRLYSEYSYTYVEGTITNNSDSTVSFVKIKGAFEDSYGTVIDTDWTYAVGSEGLAPGESCKWHMSVDKDYAIDECTVSIIDYDVD